MAYFVLVQIDLQDAYFHVPIHQDSKKYPRFAFHSSSSTFLRSGHSSGSHCGRLPPSSNYIGNSISQRLANTPPRPSSFTLPPVSAAAKVSGHGRL